MAGIKIIAVGDSGVGKTCLLHKFSTGNMMMDYVPTVCENYSKTINFGNKEITLDLVDTAGQESYDRLRPLSYNNTKVFLMCYSPVRPESFQNVTDKWHPEVRHYCPDAKIVLVACQTDLRRDGKTLDKLNEKGRIPISYMRGLDLAKTLGATYIECSAMEDFHIREVFVEAVKVYLNPNSRPVNRSKCSVL